MSCQHPLLDAHRPRFTVLYFEAMIQPARPTGVTGTTCLRDDPSCNIDLFLRADCFRISLSYIYLFIYLISFDEFPVAPAASHGRHCMRWVIRDAGCRLQAEEEEERRVNMVFQCCVVM